MTTRGENMFGERLKQLRESKDITQQDLADILGVSVGTIGMYEIDKRMPNNKNRKKLAEYFGVSSDYLLGLSDDPTLTDTEAEQVDDLKAFLKDSDMRAMFKDYELWTDEEKQAILAVLKGQKALRESKK